MTDVAGIFARESSYLDRYVQFGEASGRVISVSFPRTPDENAAEEHPLLDRVFAYLEGTHDDFDDVEVALTVPTDHRTVLEATRQVPYGEQVTVERLCRIAGLNADDDAVVDTAREALAENPVPLFVPDHRVRDGPSGAPPDVEQHLRSIESL
jgi:methylated-DNA-[protein]-cysteine S-methyltransferase